ncbi:MAG: GC-type dockerin domain-anchored protein [Phycisphaerales bacterium]
MGEEPGQFFQAMPAVLLDGEGGVNLLFISHRDTGQLTALPEVTVRFARFPSIASMSGNNAAVRDLTQPFPVTSTFNIGLQHNDYQMAALEGCVIYCAYARTDPANPSLGSSIFVRRLLVGQCELADADMNARVNSADPVAFLSALAAGSPDADVNRDGVLNAQDFVDYTAAYTAVAGPP